MQAKKAIPDKLFFKIGEVCDLVEVEPHVLRYWEQEFSQLTPQKNRAGQRIYRRKDVEIALRIKALREEEGFTIAGAKKRLANELRAGSKLKVVPLERPLETEPVSSEPSAAQSTIEAKPPATENLAILSLEPAPEAPPSATSPPEMRALVERLRGELEALLTILR